MGSRVLPAFTKLVVEESFVNVIAYSGIETVVRTQCDVNKPHMGVASRSVPGVGIEPTTAGI